MQYKFDSGRTAIGLNTFRTKDASNVTLKAQRGLLVLKEETFSRTTLEPGVIELRHDEMPETFKTLRAVIKDSAVLKQRAQLALSKLGQTNLLKALTDVTGETTVHLRTATVFENVDNPHILTGALLAILAASYHFTYQTALLKHQAGESIHNEEDKAKVISGAILSILKRLRALEKNFGKGLKGYIVRWRLTSSTYRGTPEDCWAEPSWDEYGGLLHALRLVISVYDQVRVPIGYRCEVRDLARQLHSGILDYFRSSDGLLALPYEQGARQLVMRGCHGVIGSYAVGWFQRDGVKDFYPFTVSRETLAFIDESVLKAWKIPDFPASDPSQPAGYLRAEYLKNVMLWKFIADTGLFLTGAVLAATFGVPLAVPGVSFLPAAVIALIGADATLKSLTSRDIWMSFAKVFSLEQGEGGLVGTFLSPPVGVGGFDVQIFDRYSLHSWTSDMAQIWQVRGKRTLSYDRLGWRSMTEACRVWFGCVEDAMHTAGALEADAGEMNKKVDGWDPAADPVPPYVTMEYLEGALLSSAYLALALDIEPEIDLRAAWPDLFFTAAVPEFQWIRQQQQQQPPRPVHRIGIALTAFTKVLNYEWNGDDPRFWVIPFAIRPNDSGAVVARASGIFATDLKNGWFGFQTGNRYVYDAPLALGVSALADDDVEPGSRVGFIVIAWERDYSGGSAQSRVKRKAIELVESILLEAILDRVEIDSVLNKRYAEFKALYPSPEPRGASHISDDDLVGVEEFSVVLSGASPVKAARSLTFYNERTAYTLDVGLEFHPK
ncbi:hypothetical protein [Sorangium sp. So ce1153]|uniref:hypothetical protein n=1 Tax=Sorangium sp. So ce1153 TaxID=3133333 RepID=UPI003F62BD94